MCVCACVRACVRVCVCVCVDWGVFLKGKGAKEETRFKAGEGETKETKEQTHLYKLKNRKRMAERKIDVRRDWEGGIDQKHRKGKRVELS